MCVQILLPIISYAFAYATPENDWQSLFWHYIPSWTSVTDKRGLANFFDGGSTFYPHLEAWTTPLLWWGLFLAALFSVMLSINFIFRRQWTENEKLSYPLIQLPLAMANPRSGFFRSKAMWIGFAVAAAIDLLNGVNYLFPQVPRLSGIRAYDIADFFTVRPWNAITWFPIGIYPFAVGLAFLHAVRAVLFLLVLLPVLAGTPCVREHGRSVGTLPVCRGAVFRGVSRYRSGGSLECTPILIASAASVVWHARNVPRIRTNPSLTVSP